MEPITPVIAAARKHIGTPATTQLAAVLVDLAAAVDCFPEQFLAANISNIVAGSIALAEAGGKTAVAKAIGELIAIITITAAECYGAESAASESLYTATPAGRG